MYPDGVDEPNFTEPPKPWDQRIIPAAELLEMGVVSEINRQLGHPIGIKLAADAETGEVFFIDDRDDPEGTIFGPDMMEKVRERKQAFDSLWHERSMARVEACGWMVQPVT